MQLRKISLQAETVFHVDQVYLNLGESYTAIRNKLIHDLFDMQQMFVDSPVFKDRKHKLGRLLFIPSIVANRIVNLVKHYAEDKKVSFYHLRLKVELISVLIENESFRSQVNINVGHQQDPDSIYMADMILGEFLDPCVVGGINNVSNGHKVAHSNSLYFPVGYATTMHLDSMDGEGRLIEYEEPMFERDVVVDHYQLWLNTIAKPMVLKQYNVIAKDNQFSKILTTLEFDDRWKQMSDKFQKYMDAQFLAMEKDNTCGLMGISIIIHSPVIADLDANPFVVFEFVELRQDTRSGKVQGITLETTGQTVDVSKMPAAVTSDNKVILH